MPNETPPTGSHWLSDEDIEHALDLMLSKATAAIGTSDCDVWQAAAMVLADARSRAFRRRHNLPIHES